MSLANAPKSARSQERIVHRNPFPCSDLDLWQAQNRGKQSLWSMRNSACALRCSFFMAATRERNEKDGEAPELSKEIAAMETNLDNGHVAMVTNGKSEENGSSSFTQLKAVKDIEKDNSSQKEAEICDKTPIVNEGRSEKETTSEVKSGVTSECSDSIGNNDKENTVESRECTPLSDISVNSSVSRSRTPVNTENSTNDVTMVSKVERSTVISRSSEERSNDSLDSTLCSGESTVSSLSVKSSGPFKKGVPRARKSGPTVSKSSLPSAAKPSTESPVKNVTLNLPDFDNPIRIDSKMLDKISKLGKVNQEREGRKVKRTSLPLKVEPQSSPVIPEGLDGHFSDSSLLEKDAFGKVKKRKRKRARLGTYKLPNELKKKSSLKKKDSDNDKKEDSESKRTEGSSDASVKVKNGSIVSPISKTSNEKSPIGKSDASSPRSAFDVLKHARITPRTKNTLGSTRHRMGSGKSKAQSSLDAFLNLADPKTSPGIKQEMLVEETEDADNGTRRAGLRKRKKEDDDSDESSGVNKETDSSNVKRKRKPLETSQIISTKEEKNVEPPTAPASCTPLGHKSIVPTTVQSATLSTPTTLNNIAQTKSLPMISLLHGGMRPGTTILQTQNPMASGIVTGSHAPLILVPVNSTSPVNAIPLPTSLSNSKTSPSSAAQPKIILSVPDPKISTTVAGSSIQQAPRFILMTNVGQIPPNARMPSATPIIQPRNIAQPNMINSLAGIPRQPGCPLLTSTSIQELKSSATTVSSSAPVLSKILNSRLHAPNNDRLLDEEERGESPNPDSMTYPVTPPKTPEDQQSEDSSSVASAPSGPIPPDKDIIPLCSCKINGASFKKLGTGVTYCQALDSVDGKIMGCCNKVGSSQLVRPGVKIPFMSICEAHRKRLRLHQCCPGCGHFCTQGKFYQCKKPMEGVPNHRLPVHYFHTQCHVLRNGRYHCPHCGEESEQYEVTLTLDEPRPVTTNNTVVEDLQKKTSTIRAKMGIHAGTYRSFLKPEKDPTEDDVTATYKMSADKSISTGGLPFGPDKQALEKVIATLSEDRPKSNRKPPKFLYNPAYEGDIERVALMLSEGHNPNEVVEEFDNQTPLHAACLGGHMAIVHILVQMGAFIHALDKELKTPLMYAAESNHIQIFRYLVKCKANVFQKAEDGMTVLHYTAKAGHIEIMKLLLDMDNMDVNVQDDGGWTPIIWASEHKLASAVRFLIKHGADPNLKDKEENTSLHWAAYSGSVDIAEMFLNAGSDLETPNEHGDRPLHIAARQDHYECVVLFLARGADVEARNKENETPIQCCIDENSPVWLALKVNKQLRGFAANRIGRVDKLIDRDVSRGRENIPIAVINGVDDDGVPTDFQYITENVETVDLNINRTITSLQSCRCSDDCSSMYCVCGRNSIKCWYDKSYHLLPDFSMTEPPFIFECNRGCRCWSTCNNRVVQNGITCRFQMMKTEGRGWGVKTLLDIPKGTFICEYIGELISDSEADSREDDSYLFDLDNRDGDTYCIDARRYGNIARFINHLCEPNIIPVKVFVDHQDLRFPRICFFSSRDIKAEEELGFDYGEKFWIIKWKQFTCACGSPKCKYSKDTIQRTLEEYKLRHEDEEPID
ncbi:hypothetical protein FSP39_007912 [Pinctada imbricata]|uniref:Histone-lysine N-methyltransferase EHMT2 n=1 Tax=Pinctada imbricata TaxID=66713 RepID=A0AA88XKQ9_PINIB|nr:hypothetical protein FSP39_007912 [Pinctada imbricata]